MYSAPAVGWIYVAIFRWGALYMCNPQLREVLTGR
jgi:hypothetical protein